MNIVLDVVRATKTVNGKGWVHEGKDLHNKGARCVLHDKGARYVLYDKGASYVLREAAFPYW